MVELRKLILLAFKAAIVILIPYYWMGSVLDTPPIPEEIGSILGGTWGVIPSGRVIYSTAELLPFWYYNQIVFSLIFILPLIAFSFFFEDRALDKLSIVSAGAAILVSATSVYLLTPDYMFGTMIAFPDETLPSVISFSIFVFIFWPFLKNSWPRIEAANRADENPDILSKFLTTLREITPINTPSLVWVCMVILPAAISISGIMSTQTIVRYYLQITGLIWRFNYDYQWVLNEGQLRPMIIINSDFTTATWITPWTFAIWILSLWLGIITLRFINGKSTIKQVRILAGILILIYMIFTLPITILTLLWSPSALPYLFYSIPLPLYSIAMLLIAKFGHPPTPKIPLQEGMIRIPLSARISSRFRRSPRENEVIEKKLDYEEDRSDESH